MDDQTLLATTVHYRCPGECHDIDRATHLGRLAAFYPPCRDCVHRRDIGELTAPQVRQWSEVLARKGPPGQFGAEGFEGGSVNEVGREVVARVAAALGVTLWRNIDKSVARPSVLVASDGHWSSAESLAAACDALALAGCSAIEGGSATAPSLAAAARHLAADAAVWIGNASGEPLAVSVRCWGRAGRPWSSPGGLDDVRAAFESRSSRPRRRGGWRSRATTEEFYLEPIAPLFHALRPLRLVLDTTCRPLVRQMERLAEKAACEVLRCEGFEGHDANTKSDVPHGDRRLRAVGRQVVDRQADFGVWADGCGESCRLVDERGHAVDHGRLFGAMARYVLAEKPGAMLLVDGPSGDAMWEELAALGAGIVRGGRSRESTCAAMESSGAVFGSGPNDTFWFAGAPAAPDALLAISLVLKLLSQSDRACSEVLDAPVAAL